MFAQGTFDTDQIITDHIKRFVGMVFKLDRTCHQIGIDMRRNRGWFTVVVHKANPYRIMFPVIIPDAAMT